MGHVEMYYPDRADEYTMRRQAEADAAHEEELVEKAVFAERARIRALALSEAGKEDLSSSRPGDSLDLIKAAAGAQALRDFAALLEDR